MFYAFSNPTLSQKPRKDGAPGAPVVAVSWRVEEFEVLQKKNIREKSIGEKNHGARIQSGTDTREAR
jgi:hypothetical protein